MAAVSADTRAPPSSSVTYSLSSLTPDLGGQPSLPGRHYYISLHFHPAAREAALQDTRPYITVCTWELKP